MIQHYKPVKTLLLACAAICLAQPQAKGDLIITVGNASISAGGTGFVDVMITGDVGDTLGRFGYEFNITGAVAGAGDLQFQVVQSSSEQGVGPGPGSYVFFGDTDPGIFSAMRGSGGTDPITLVGGDLLNTLNDVSVNGTFLLARLELQHLTPFSLISHPFTISLNTASAFTEFDTDFDSGTANNYLSGQITAFSGTITVVAVPEPSSVAIVALGTIAFVIRRRKRNRPAGTT